MYKFYLSVIISFLFFCQSLSAQHLYYKYVKQEILIHFADTSHKINFVNADTTVDYTNHIKYILRYYPNLKYENIEVIFRKSQTIAKAKPTFKCLFLAPEKRRYKIYFSNSCKGALDSVKLSKLETNSQLGLIARQIGHLYEFSTNGFFDLLGWHFKQLSRNSKKKLEYDNELRVIEQGCGYQLLSLSKYETEKLVIENWKDANAYSKYVKRDKDKFMSPETIMNFISDMPVYVSHQYK